MLDVSHGTDYDDVSVLIGLSEGFGIFLHSQSEEISLLPVVRCFLRIFMDCSMKPSPSLCLCGNIKQDFAEENTKPGSLAAVQKDTGLG